MSNNLNEFGKNISEPRKANGATPDRQNFDYVKKHGLTDYLAHRTESRYSIGWALFDVNNPTKLISRCEEPVLEPKELYELFGHVGLTIFGCGLVNFNSKYHLYYGCNDNRISVAIEEKNHPWDTSL